MGIPSRFRLHVYSVIPPVEIHDVQKVDGSGCGHGSLRGAPHKGSHGERADRNSAFGASLPS